AGRADLTRGAGRNQGRRRGRRVGASSRPGQSNRSYSSLQRVGVDGLLEPRSGRLGEGGCVRGLAIVDMVALGAALAVAEGLGVWSSATSPRASPCRSEPGRVT